MAKKTLGYTKLVWTCPNCATRNPGPNRFCNGCGAPMPQEVRFEQPAEAELITDAAELAHARAGPDRHCPYCGARNRGDSRFCGACGGDLAGGAARQAGRVVGAHRAPSSAKVECPACGTPNPLTGLRCTNCGSALPPAPATPPETAPGSPRRRLPRIVVAAALGLVALAAGTIVFLGQQRDERSATVERVRWERAIEVERFGPVERSGWQDEIPPGAKSVACELAFYETQDEPAPVATEVCGTPYTIDTGSGYGQVVQDCSYRVYRPRCSYTVDDWSVVEVRRMQGDDLLPAWPTLDPAAGERAGEQTESYSVILVSAGDRFSHDPDSEATFRQFAVGSRWTITVNGLGAIVEITPAP